MLVFIIACSNVSITVLSYPVVVFFFFCVSSSMRLVLSRCVLYIMLYMVFNGFCHS
ncbi:hypothetical protein QL093DRAFT_2223328 [Fusarium oxysporum]|nr:hypothetical protein QL093DRAFT_2223328 [Fusarium oxysporum]